MQIRQVYVKQSVMFIPMGTSHSAVFLFCSTCETKTYVTSWKYLFAGQDAQNKLIELLESGRELTKHWVNQLSYKDREQALKRLNLLKAHTVVKYIGT